MHSSRQLCRGEDKLLMYKRSLREYKHLNSIINFNRIIFIIVRMFKIRVTLFFWVELERA